VVSTEVPQPIEQVWDFLDVLANHESFTDHVMRDWRLSGPERGVGAKVRLRVKGMGRMEIEVIDADPPCRSVERNVSAGGRRVGLGTYVLTRLSSGGTRIAFTYAWLQPTRGDRLLAPLLRTVMRKTNERVLARLAEQLATR